MQKKGISPLIASVLLIAFVMAIASIFATFATDVINQPTDETTERASELTRCSSALVEVDDGSNASEILLTQTNGDNPVANMSVCTQFTGSVRPLQNYTCIDTRRVFTELDTGIPADADVQAEKVTVSVVDQEGEGCSRAPEVTAEFPLNTP